MIEAFTRPVAGKDNRSGEVRKGMDRRWIGEIVRRDIDSLDRGDRAGRGVGDSFLQSGELGAHRKVVNGRPSIRERERSHGGHEGDGGHEGLRQREPGRGGAKLRLSRGFPAASTETREPPNEPPRARGRNVLAYRRMSLR
jgi:hypothetical protein